MSKTEPGEKESYKNYNEHLEDYEYNISLKKEFYLASVNDINRGVLHEMFKDKLISQAVYMKLYPRQIPSELEISRKEYHHEKESQEMTAIFCFLCVIYLMFMYYSHDSHDSHDPHHM